MQEQYAQKIGVHTPGMQISDVYSLWSATNTVQRLSGHTRDKQEVKKYLSLGQKARYWYAPRGKKENEDSYGDADLGIMIEQHKQFISMHKWKTKETPEDAAKLMQHIARMDQMMDEIDRLLKNLLNHTKMGIKEGDKARFITAAKHARNFSDEQMKQIIVRSQSLINYRLKTSKKEEAQAITDWIEDILDASQGYRKAHTWTRGTSKAPPITNSHVEKG